MTWVIWHVHFALLEHCLESLDLIAGFGWCLHTVSSLVCSFRRQDEQGSDWIAQCLLMAGAGDWWGECGWAAGGVYQRTLDRSGKSAFRLKMLFGQGFSQLNSSVFVSLSWFTWIFEGCFLSRFGSACNLKKVIIRIALRLICHITKNALWLSQTRL